MDFDEYQKSARETAIYPGQNGWAARGDTHGVNYCVLGVNGEAGELAEKLKKSYRDEGLVTEERRVAMLDEAGDVLWYLSQLCSELDVAFSEVARKNLNKLAARQRRGTLTGDGDDR